MTESNWSVYRILSKCNAKSYVGITQKPLQKRLNEHFKDAYPGRYNARGTLYAFHAAIQKYGVENFTIKPLLKGLSLDQAQTQEKKFIKKYNSYGGFKNKKGLPRGYNQSLGGETPDFEYSALGTVIKRKRNAVKSKKKTKSAVPEKLEENGVNSSLEKVSIVQRKSQPYHLRGFIGVLY